jgi:hypothetical protein
VLVARNQRIIMSSQDDEVSRTIVGKIEREKALITAANVMRQSTDNPMVLNGIDTKIRDGHRNIEYLEGRLREHRLKQANQRLGNLSIQDGGQAGQASGSGAGAAGYGREGAEGQTEPGSGVMPPAAPFAKGPPGQSVPKARPNYSRLDLIKYDTPHLGPRIQLMLSQLEFKLTIEKQYKDGIDKMMRLYQMEGDRKSRQDAEARGIESNQKIQLLKQALKRYEDVNVQLADDENDGEYPKESKSQSY